MFKIDYNSKNVDRLLSFSDGGSDCVPAPIELRSWYPRQVQNSKRGDTAVELLLGIERTEPRSPRLLRYLYSVLVLVGLESAALRLLILHEDKVQSDVLNSVIQRAHPVRRHSELRRRLILNSDPQKTVPALISHEHKEYLKELDQRLVVPTLLRFALNRSDAAVFSIELIAELGAVEALKNLRSIRQQEGKIPDWKAMVAHARTTKTQDGPAKELERLVTLKRRVQALEDAIAKLENKSTSKD